MTSTTFSGKLKQGRSFFLWSLFTGKTTMIIYLSLLTFFSMVIFVFGFGISASVDGSPTAVFVNGFSESVNGIWQGAALFEIMITQTLALVFTFVFSIKEFSYLHDKRKTDMFGSLPASRRTIFFSKLAAVIVQSTLPMLIVMTFLAIMNGEVVNIFNLRALLEMDTEPHMINLWYYMLREFTGLVVNAVFLGFLSICCGKTADKVLSYLIINAAYPISALLVQVMPASFVIGYSVDINEFITCAFSPYLAMSTINPIYWGIFAVAFGVLCFFLLPRRKAECAQSHFAFKAPLIITKLLVSFAAGMVLAYLFGMIFSLLGGDKIAFAIGWLLGSFTAYFIIQIIFAKGFKGFGWGMIPYAGLVVFFAIIMVVFNTGLLGYESYVPKVDDVESVSLIGDHEIIINNKAIDGKITDKNEIEECIEGHKEALRFRQEDRASIGAMTFGEIDKSLELLGYEETGNVKFTYKLKNGMTVTRDYGYFNSSEVGFIATPTYIKNTSELFLIDPEYSSELYFETPDMDDAYDSEIEIDGEKYALDDSSFETTGERIEFIEALKSDILTYGTHSGEEVCNVTVYYDTDNDIMSESAYLIITSEHKNTLELLKKNATKSKEAKTATSV